MKAASQIASTQGQDQRHTKLLGVFHFSTLKKQQHLSSFNFLKSPDHFFLERRFNIEVEEIRQENNYALLRAPDRLSDMQGQGEP